MKAEIIVIKEIYNALPSPTDWFRLALFGLLAMGVLLFVYMPFKRFLQGDKAQLGLAYLGVIIITAVGLANGGFI